MPERLELALREKLQALPATPAGRAQNSFAPKGCRVPPQPFEYTTPVSLWTIRLVLASYRNPEKDVSNSEPCLCWLPRAPLGRHVWSLPAYCPVFHIAHPSFSLKCSFPISP